MDQKIKIMDLTLGTPVDTDFIPFVDVSDTTQSAAGSTKRALKSELKGDTGDNATATAGTTTTGVPGSSASVTNVGTTSDAIFNFTIPRGDVGSQGIQGIQGIQGVAGTDGESFTWLGAYSGATGYVVNDVVSYNGSSYICILESTGNIPTNVTYWSVMALKGTDGIGTGDVVGPASAVDNRVAFFDGTTGKLIKDSGLNLSGSNTGDNSPNTNSGLVHTTGTETIAGVKTFSDEVKITYGKGIFNTGYTNPALKTDWAFADTGGGDSTRITPAGSAVTSNMVYSGSMRNGSKGDFYVEGNETITGTISASNLSGTNSGDQTSIVGITGTKAQFDTACTDGNFLYSGDIISASTTAQGIVELATTAEINTGTDSTRAIPIDQFVASNRNVRYFDIYAIEKATDNAVGTNIIGSIECPFTGTITEIGAYVETAGVTGASVWDVNKNGTTIMTTNKLSIDSAEVSTRTATTAPTLTTTAITAGDLITIDTDSLSTTKPKGLHVRIGIRQS